MAKEFSIIRVRKKGTIKYDFVIVESNQVDDWLKQNYSPETHAEKWVWSGLKTMEEAEAFMKERARGR